MGCVKTAFISVGVGFVLSIFQDLVATSYLSDFLRSNLISLLIALLAINSATLGVVLTKIRDLADKHGGIEYFRNTKAEMIISLHEQISLIVIGTLLLMIEKSSFILGLSYSGLVLRVLLSAVFIYSMIVLYDTAKSVFCILDFNPKQQG
ncbi:MAG: hypothetical protein NTW91_09415 [Verrucomicrobia bacterium]|nr:hypothetical protein [Verrucomicrobiota bacterium]